MSDYYIYFVFFTGIAVLVLYSRRVAYLVYADHGHLHMWEAPTARTQAAIMVPYRRHNIT